MQEHIDLPSGIDPHWRIAVIHAAYHGDVVRGMLKGAEEVLREAGIRAVSVHEAHGSFELPLIGAALLEEGKVDALIALGVIVEGETHHASLIAEATARGIMDLQIRHGVPFAFEVLYVDDIALAEERAGGKAGNRGAEAARAVLHSLAQLKSIGS